MQYILTHYGHRWITHQARSGALSTAPVPRESALCAALFAREAVPVEANPALAPLVERGLVCAVPDAVSLDAVRLRYARNPIEHIERVVFEYTTLCNLDCVHCRNSNLEAVHEREPAALLRVGAVMIPLGVTRFDFIGGEVTAFAKGWLDLVRSLRALGAAHTSVITSGWFLEERDFLAAGKRYCDDRAYFEDLRDSGLTHVVFSVDGPASIHDALRRTPGLYARILRAFDRVRDCGLVPRVSIIAHGALDARSKSEWLETLARGVYGDASATPDRLLRDESNYASNLVDVGGAVQLRRSRQAPVEIPDDLLRCKNFFRPSPTFRVKASGEVSLCPLVEGGDGYGNVHDRDPIAIINEMHETLVYQLHAENAITAVRPLLDGSLFDTRIQHVCTLRTAINMLARVIVEEGIDPSDHDRVREANVRVAEKMGFLPRVVKHRANGHAVTREPSR